MTTYWKGERDVILTLIINILTWPLLDILTGPPGILYEGGFPIIVYKDSGLPFLYRPINSVQDISICDISNNNSITSTLLRATPPMINRTCITPEALLKSDLLQFMVTVKDSPLQETITKLVTIVEGDCPGTDLSSPMYSITCESHDHICLYGRVYCS